MTPEITPEERAWADSVRSQAMAIVVKCMRVQQETAEGSTVRRIARDAGLMAIALMNEAAQRMNVADITTAAEEMAASGYDLAALATAAPSPIED